MFLCIADIHNRLTKKKLAMREWNKLKTIDFLFYLDCKTSQILTTLTY